MKYDVIVIGAGHNGLTCAATLAKAGRKVLVLEAAAKAGGLAAERTFHPGYTVPGILHDTTGVRARVVSSLGLAKHGLRFVEEERASLSLAPGAAPIPFYRDPVRTAPYLRQISPNVAGHYASYCGFLKKIGRFLEPLVNDAPPQIAASNASDMWGLLKAGTSLRRLGRAEMIDFLRIGPMPVNDWVREYFADERIGAFLAGPAVWGSFLGPWSPGTTATLLMQEAARGAEVEGGSAALVRSLEAAALANGAEVRTEAAVTKIVVGEAGATGVTLASGETIEAKKIASSCDPKTTFLDLVEPARVSIPLEAKIRNYRQRGVIAKLHYALGAPFAPGSGSAAGAGASAPGASGANGVPAFSSARIAASLAEIERSFDSVKYGTIPEAPYLDLFASTATDTSLAPDGHAVLSVCAYGIPYEPEGGWTDDRRRELQERVDARIESVAPGFAKSVVHCELLTPPDLARELRIHGGHLYHGEHGLDQLLFMRPVAPCSRYATPVPGLYLCGSGSHPGGGITCAPGSIAAGVILKG
ncbi:MAG: NAD(P)/FAD-dependent oxidoreductase [Gemmatimonadetes bacterium]|nr:NAD(P)/FAD-dependent oxidoreductase [Gemmatimonadota bacterium]